MRGGFGAGAMRGFRWRRRRRRRKEEEEPLEVVSEDEPDLEWCRLLLIGIRITGNLLWAMRGFCSLGGPGAGRTQPLVAVRGRLPGGHVRTLWAAGEQAVRAAAAGEEAAAGIVLPTPESRATLYNR